MTLDNRARYFFTSTLTGCRIQVVPGEYPTVLHIAGDFGGNDGGGTGGSQWRERQAQTQLGPLYGQSRRFSSTYHYDKTDVAFVVGYRSIRFNGWRFIAQGLRQDMGAYKMYVSDLSTYFAGKTVRI